MVSLAAPPVGSLFWRMSRTSGVIGTAPVDVFACTIYISGVLVRRRIPIAVTPYAARIPTSLIPLFLTRLFCKTTDFLNS